MVMHSNEREEYCPRPLVDRKWKRYQNAVDVVERLHDLIDPSTEHMAPLSSAHVHLDDVPRTPIQQSFTGRVSSARRRGDDLDVLPSQGFA